MLLRTPDFYPKFHCIADKCTDSCCIGWEIDVDRITQEKYRQVKSEFKKKLDESVRDGHFVLTTGDRCPFLDKCGLCEIYTHLGEDALCDICREHPRFVEVYGDIKEQGIGLCCEEGVRLLLEETHPVNSAAPGDANRRETEEAENAAPEKAENAAPEDANNAAPIMQFIESEVDDIPDELPDDARDARDQIFAERKNMFAILSQHEKPLNKRLQMLLEYAVEVSGISEDSISENNENIDKDRPSKSSDNAADSVTDNATNNTVNNAADIHADNAADIAKIYREWIGILGNGESFGPAWDKAYKAISEKGWHNFGNKNSYIQKDRGTKATCRESLFSDLDGAKIVAYMLFRYYAKSLFDGDSLGKVQFAIFFWIILREFGQELAGISENEVPAADPKNKFIDPRIAAVKLLSKQVEYSDEVMELLAEAFANDEAFGVERFLLLLQEK
ncbi:flagellin lysine-N-methylase [Fibrobacter sp.]|uniref:flagellin lysine-N-methylase n=1 Tax=Fibrobacter sp. TaxID=35828 RepID=UPI003890535F